MLRTLNRLTPITDGKIEYRGIDILNFPEIQLRRQIGYVLQQPALFPHWTTERNIGLVPRLLEWSREKIEARTKELLELMQMPYEKYSHRYPSELSGGEQQRIGIARALAANPKLVLYDEPFSALDPITRSDLQQEVLRLKKKMHITSVFVTHQVKEAFLLGDRVLILHHGKVVQIGTPKEIKQNPANEFVRKFIDTEYD